MAKLNYDQERKGPSGDESLWEPRLFGSNAEQMDSKNVVRDQFEGYEL